MHAAQPPITAPQAKPPFTGGWFALLAIYATNLGVGILFGFQPPLIALVLHRTGVSSLEIGAITSIATIAVIVLGPWYPRLLNRWGLKKSIAYGILLAAALQFFMPLNTQPGCWLLLRFVSGCGLGLAWIGTEVWLNRIATDHTRGRLMATYATVFAAGVLAGPLLLQWTGTEGSRPFYIGAAALVLTVLPLAFLRRGPDGGADDPEATGFIDILRIAPSVMLAALTAGLIEAADISLRPIYGVASGLSENTALQLITIFLLGNVLLQLPIGAMADRFGRKPTLAVCALISVIGPLLLPLAMSMPALLWPLLFIWGGTLYGFYAQGIALVGDSYATHDLAHANTVFVMVYCTGGVVGPSLGGFGMDLWRPTGLVIVLSAAALILWVGLCWEYLRSTRLARG